MKKNIFDFFVKIRNDQKKSLQIFILLPENAALWQRETEFLRFDRDHAAATHVERCDVGEFRDQLRDSGVGDHGAVREIE